MSPSVSTAKELLARLVAFDTASNKTTIPLIDFVETYLAGSRGDLGLNRQEALREAAKPFFR
jgi:hypothetical protein